MKPRAFPLGGTWAGLTARESDGRSIRCTIKVCTRKVWAKKV